MSTNTTVGDWCDLRLIKNLIVPGRSDTVLFVGDVLNTRVLVVRTGFHYVEKWVQRVQVQSQSSHKCGDIILVVLY